MTNFVQQLCLRNRRWVILLVFAPGLANAQNQTRSQVEEFTHRNGSEILQSLKQLVELPNVSADQDNVRKNAEYLVKQFASRGATMELLEVAGANPVIYGEINHPSADRTLLIYIHYDGQPVEVSRWKSTEPFKPVLYTRSLEDGGRKIDWPTGDDQIDPEWRIYGRSTSDDKAPFIALLAALDAFRESKIPLTSNIKFFFDGEEEIGSPNMLKVLSIYADKFDDVDLWLFCDGPLHQSRKPSVYFGVRGICGMEITVYGATRNLHSGHYGNWAPNSGMLLAQLLASMKDNDGNVMVEGFYDSVTELTEQEKEELAAIPKIDDDLRRELGLAESENKNQPYMDRMQLPSLNIKGIECGSTGTTARNIVPNRATAALDIRLVKGNSPSKMIELVKQHIRQQGYTVVEQEPNLEQRRTHARIAKVVTGFSGYPAARTAMDHPEIGPIINSLESFSGKEGLLKVPGLGGSLPLYLISDYLKQPLMILPMANHDNNQHSPDENLRVGNLMYGIKAMAAILSAEPKQVP